MGKQKPRNTANSNDDDSKDRTPKMHLLDEVVIRGDSKVSVK